MGLVDVIAEHLEDGCRNSRCDPETPRPMAEHLIALVKADPDLIVIERRELPAVQVRANGVHVAGEGASMAHRQWGDATQYRGYALAALAIAEHMRLHPPADEAQVKALAQVLVGASDWKQVASLARRLVQAGVRVERALGGERVDDHGILVWKDVS